MKITVVRPDNTVIIDGVAIADIDMSSIPEDIHAIQAIQANNANVMKVEYTTGARATITNINMLSDVIAQHNTKRLNIEAAAADPYYGLSTDERLEAEKLVKLGELATAFAAADAASVMVSGIPMRGGFISVLALNGERDRLVAFNDDLIAAYKPRNPPTALVNSTYSFTDNNGDLHTVPLDSTTELDAKDICFAVALQVRLNHFKHEMKVKAVKLATTSQEVANISWID